MRLPVDFGALPRAIEGIAARLPGALLLLGEAPGRSVRLEGVGLNLVHALISDNAGKAPLGEALVTDAPFALPARWDARGIAAGLRSEGVPASPSYHAGTFACNAALFLALRRLPEEVPVGFVHLPRRGWPLGPRDRTLRRGVRLALDALLRYSPAQKQG